VSKLLAVAARELRERWILFPAGLVLGCVPLVLPAFGLKREVCAFVGLFGALCLGAAAAVVIGSTMLARDVATGRLGFLFSRPAPWTTIWGGKWLAAFVLVTVTALLAAIPWMAVYPLASVGGHHGDSWLRAMLDGPGTVFCFMLIVLVVGLASFNATAFRSRSPWLVLDMLLLLAGLWVVRRWVAPLFLYGILAANTAWSQSLLPLPLAVALLAGSAAQVAVGRTDVRRAHRAMSVAFWAVVAVTLAAAAGYWHWVRSAGPADVTVHAVTRDPAGRWIYAEGSGRHSGWYPHGFLIDTTSGRYLLRPPPRDDGRYFPSGVLFSADSRFAALPHSDGSGAAITLFDLTGSPPHAVEVALESSPPPAWQTEFALSPSAASVFVAHESGASLFALPSGRRVATATIPPGWRPADVRFLAEGAARAWLVPANDRPGAPRAEMRVVDLAVDGSSRSVTFPIATPLDAPRSWGAVVPDADGRRIVTVDSGLHLRDGATGTLTATLAEGGGNPRALFLADGRIVVAGDRIGGGGPLQAVVRVFDRAGAPLGEMRPEIRPGGLVLGPEVAPGRVAVSSFRAWFLPEDTLIVDVGEGRVVERLAGLRPDGFWNVAASRPAGSGPTSVHFFRDTEGRVLRLDFASGERRIVAGPGALPGERLR